jgi:hypothetical protein
MPQKPYLVDQLLAEAVEKNREELQEDDQEHFQGHANDR